MAAWNREFWKILFVREETETHRVKKREREGVCIMSDSLARYIHGGETPARALIGLTEYDCLLLASRPLASTGKYPTESREVRGILLIIAKASLANKDAVSSSGAAAAASSATSQSPVAFYTCLAVSSTPWKKRHRS